MYMSNVYVDMSTYIYMGVCFSGARFISSKLPHTHVRAHTHRAGEIGTAAPVLAGPVFLKVKAKFHFCKRQVINKVLV